MTFELAKFLKNRFAKLGISTYAEAASITGVSADYISKILRGIRVPEDQIIVKLAQGLEVDEGELLMLAKKDKAPDRLKRYFERPRPKFFHFKPGQRVRWLGELPFLLEVDPQLIKKAKEKELNWKFEDHSAGENITIKCLIADQQNITEVESIDINCHRKRLMAEIELKAEDIEMMIDFLSQKGKQICRAQSLDRTLRKALTMGQIYDPLIEKQVVMAAALSKSGEYLSDYREDSMAGKMEIGALVPIISYADAGEGFNYTDQSYPAGAADEYVAKPVDLRDPSAYALKVKGDSMFPKLDEGDVIIVSPQQEAKSNNLAVIRTKKGDVYLKKVIFAQNTILLQSINPNYAPLSLKVSDIKFIHPVIWIKPKEK
jgi:SOS-response transcriptional repressor LexA/transcriptional regulator with XRE-family HTH domain